MPTNTNNPKNSYTFNTAKRLFGSQTAYNAANDTQEKTRQYNESTRNRQNLEMADVGSHVILSAKNAALLEFEWCEYSGFQIVGRYGFTNYYHYDSEGVLLAWRIGHNAIESGFPLEVIAELTTQLWKYGETRVVMMSDNTSYSATRSDNGKYTEVKVKKVSNKVYKRNRRVW